MVYGFGYDSCQSAKMKVHTQLDYSAAFLNQQCIIYDTIESTIIICKFCSYSQLQAPPPFQII